jgi:hypothetical protein
MWEIPMYIVLHAFMFVCVLSLRDVIRATLDLVPIPKTGIYWMWFETILQIAIGCTIIAILSHCEYVDPRSFING